MKPSTESRPPLPPQCAFVIQFTDQTELERGRVEGRVEHVVSGAAVRFDSLEALIAFFARVLTAQRPLGGG